MLVKAWSSEVATMRTVNVYEAKTQLSKLLGDVEAGEEIVIARNGVPVARLSPVKKVRTSSMILPSSRR